MYNIKAKIAIFERIETTFVCFSAKTEIKSPGLFTLKGEIPASGRRLPPFNYPGNR
jgi:hypothetical protein